MLWPVGAWSVTAELLDEIRQFVRRFVVLTDAQVAVVALWVAHTYAIESFETTPYLHICSPTKRAGKSRLLDVLEALCRKPLRAAGATEAALFRAISDRHPTILFDEIDTIFGPKARDHEDLRALLNAGFRRGTPVLRCVGEGTKMSAREFEVFCCKALAGIGSLPDTISDRSLTISLKRKGRGEQVERFRIRTTPHEADYLRANLESWADEYGDRLELATPHLPDELDDRAQDVAEPLLAIADLAGGEWPALARGSIVEVRNGSTAADEDAGTQLLGDIRKVFEAKGVDRLSTEWLLAGLCEDVEAPWRGWHRGNPLSARGLGRLLRGFDVHSRTVRLDDNTTPKGFLREQFVDAWNRYAPENGAPNATTPQPAWLSGKPPVSIRHATPLVAATKTGANPHGYSDVADVADTTAENASAHENGALTEADIADLGRANLSDLTARYGAVD